MGSFSLIHWIVFIAIIGLVVSALARAGRRRSDPVGALVCTRCGTRTNARTETRGSFIIELALWLLFIIPGLIYSLWRLSSRRDVCHACGAPDLVPVDSPVGRKLLSEHHA